MKRLHLQMLCILSLCLSILACRQEDPAPEMRDPIYKDLKSRADAYEKSHADGKALLEAARLSREKAEANSIELKNVRRDIAKYEKQLVGDEQLNRYYKIRAERRRILARKAYKNAFAVNKEWPDPSEYSDYLVNKRLHEINMNWSSRVPKLQDRLPSAVAKLKPKSTDAGQ